MKMKSLSLLVPLASSLLCLLCSSGPVRSADSIPVLQWDVETSRPAPQAIPLYSGETLSLEPRFLSYGAVLTLSNVTAVVLQYRCTGMAAGTYYPLTGAVVSASSGRVRVLWTPSAEGTNSAYTYNLVASGSSGSVYRCFGTIAIANTSSGSPGLVPAAAYATPTYVDAQDVAYSNAITAWVNAAGFVPSNSAATFSALTVGSTTDDLFTPAMVIARGIDPASATFGSLDLQTHAKLWPSTGGETYLYARQGHTVAAVEIQNVVSEGLGSVTIRSNLIVTGSTTMGGTAMSFSSTGVCWTVNGTNNWLLF